MSNQHRVHSCDSKELCQVEPDLIPVRDLVDNIEIWVHPKNPDTYGKHDRTYFEGII